MSLRSNPGRSHPRKFILDDFLSIRKCVNCECYAPAAFIDPESAAEIIQKSETVKKNSDLDIYMAYLSTMDNEKIRAELIGRPKPEDVISDQSL